MTSKISLADGREALVDEDDFDALSRHRWCAFGRYAGRYEGDTLILMHRQVNKTPDGMHTDHINANPLDNRKENLRTVTALQNQMNRSPNKKGSSRLKGAWFDSSSKQEKRWRSSIRLNGRQKYLGRFLTQQEAHEAYKAAAAEHFGIYARTE